MDSDRTLHVAPVGDLVDHDTSTDQPDCVCGPAVQHVEADQDGWLIVHHALEGREQIEETP